GDMYRCSAALRDIGEVARDADDAAERIVDYLFQELADPGTTPESSRRQCALIRLFRTRTLPPVHEELDHAAANDGARSPSSMPCLALWATRGLEPEWNRPAGSRRHRVIPLVPDGTM